VIATRSSSPAVFAPPRLVTRLDDCVFYHTMDLPGYGVVGGPWDLRGTSIRTSRGRTPQQAGSRTGHRRRVPAAARWRPAGPRSWRSTCPRSSTATSSRSTGASRRRSSPSAAGFVRKLNNGWWLAHRACGSSARVVVRLRVRHPGRDRRGGHRHVRVDPASPPRPVPRVRVRVPVGARGDRGDRTPVPLDQFPLSPAVVEESPGGWRGRLLCDSPTRLVGDRGCGGGGRNNFSPASPRPTPGYRALARLAHLPCSCRPPRTRSRIRRGGPFARKRS